MATSPALFQAGTSANASFRMRAARRGDGEGLSTMIRELGYPDGVDTSTLNWVISHPEIEIVVATDLHDRPIAMLTLSHRPQLRLRGRIACIDELVVTSAWRRKGVARALVRWSFQRAKSLSATRLELRTHGAQIDPVVTAFAKACGFTQVEPNGFSVVP